MDRDAFLELLRSSIPEGTRMVNPGGGTSTVLWIDSDRVSYQRGQSRFYVSLADLHDAFQRFSGSEVTTRLLKDYSPSVFDSASGGHNCHCTFLFLVLQKMGIVERINGSGRRGAPFGVTIP